MLARLAPLPGAVLGGGGQSASNQKSGPHWRPNKIFVECNWSFEMKIYVCYVYLACSARLLKGLYVLHQVWDVNEYIYISIVVSQIITKFKESVARCLVFNANVFFFDLKCMLVNWDRLVILGLL